MSTPSSPVASTVSLPTPPGPHYHPDFTGTSGLNADVTLVARDGMHFRINATALRLASGVFETTLSLPQPVAETEWKEPVINSLDEDSEVLADLLRIISGKEIDPDRLISLDFLQTCLLAAEKWDMRGALSIMRILLRTNPNVSSDPMSVYWLGSHFRWRDVTSLASKYCCKDELFRAEESLPGQMDATDLLGLIKFHQARNDQMKSHLFDDVASLHGVAWNRCSKMVLNADYQAFAWRVLEEMDRTPPACKITGSRLRLFAQETQMNDSRCRSCNIVLRSKHDIIKQVKIDRAGLRQILMD